MFIQVFDNKWIENIFFKNSKLTAKIDILLAFLLNAHTMVASLLFYSNIWHWISTANLLNLGCPIDQTKKMESSERVEYTIKDKENY